jgi:tetraacyldisaccharide 4'-kinase
MCASKLRSKLEQWFTAVWYQNKPISILSKLGLTFLSRTYQFLRLATRQQQKAKRSKSTLVRKPIVLVIGNLIAGGAGKTPVVMAVCKHLKHKGLQVGLISRGYKRQHTGTQVFSSITPSVNVNTLGDEPYLLASHTGCPIAVGTNRQEALEHLLQVHPNLDLIIADDGLQHHRLQRDLEWVVFDQRAAGNRKLLPEGPLREPLTRLKHVDAVLCNGLSTQELASSLQLPAQPCWHPIQVTLLGFRRKTDGLFITTEQAQQDWSSKTILAFAGLGHPEKFFDTLRSSGIECTRTLSLGDHFNYPEAYDHQFPEDILLTTGKDAVKLYAATPKLWVAEIDVQLPTPLIHLLEDRLGLATD